MCGFIVLKASVKCDFWISVVVAFFFLKPPNVKPHAHRKHVVGLSLLGANRNQGGNYIKEELGGGAFGGNAGSLNALCSSLESVVMVSFRKCSCQAPLTCHMSGNKGGHVFYRG